MRAASSGICRFRPSSVVTKPWLRACSLILDRESHVTPRWLWLPLIWLLEVAFTCGLALGFSVLNVFIRDTRYVVESANTVLFWLVPIFYSFESIPVRFKDLYQYNPIAALVLAMRQVILDDTAPSETILMKAGIVSILAVAGGWLVFRQLKPRLYDYL